MKGRKLLTQKTFLVVSVGIKPLLVHVVEAPSQEYCFPVTESLPRYNLTYHLGSTTKALAKLLAHLDFISTKGGGLHAPHTRSLKLLHTKLEG